MGSKLTPELEAALADRLRQCDWCGRPFVATTPHHKYCRPSHQVMAARRRSRERKG